MKKIAITILLIITMVKYSTAQNPISLAGVNNASANWVNLGTFSLPQGGYDGVIQLIGGQGYNASIGQLANVTLHIRSSNGASVDGNNFGFAATASRYGRGSASLVSEIHIVPNSTGAAATAFTVYARLGPFVGGSFFTTTVAPGMGWTTSNTIVSGDPGGYIVPFESFVLNNTYVLANLGVGTDNLYGYALAVNGSAIATSVTVKLYADWPDYVFKPTYQLPALSEVKTYIDRNQHLPEMPSADEVEKNGVNLGEIVKLQTKKIEELTLYLIEKEKKDTQLQEQIDSLKKQLEVIIKAAAPHLY